MSLKVYPPRKGVSKNYSIRGSVNGTRVDCSSGSDNRLEAEKKCREIERDIKRGRYNVETKMTFAQAAIRYVANGGDGKFLEKISKYFGSKPIESITNEDIETCALTLYPQCSNASRNRAVSTPVSAVMKAVGIERKVWRPKNAKGEERTFFFEPDEAARLLEAAHKVEPEFGIFLTYLLYTGARLSEGLRLETRHLNLEQSRAYLTTTKNGKPRAMHLPTPLVAALANHPRGLNREGRVFRFVAGLSLNKKLRKAADMAGVYIPEGIAFHAFRHSFGAWMRRYGGLDTSGLVATGAWTSHAAARRYEHTDVTVSARASDNFPILKRNA